MLPSKDASQSPDDEKILKYAVELFRKLGITKPEPDTLVWEDHMDPNTATVRFGEVKLPRIMMGRLTAEDWRPLLAPAIIYGYLLLRDEHRDSALRLILPLGLASVASMYSTLQIIHLSQLAYFRELVIANLILFLAYAASVIVLYNKRRWRSLPYGADRRASGIVGREVLLAALAKYGETLSATGYPLKRLHLWPTVGQRIEHLNKTALDNQVGLC